MTGSSEARERAITEAARRLLDMLTLDGDPPALAIPDEIEDKNAFAQAFDSLSRALSSPSPCTGEKEGWRLFTELPTIPVQAEIFYGNAFGRDQDGNECSLRIAPYRDERRAIAYWDGKDWCHCGTGHRLNEFDDDPPEWIPTYWRPLPALPGAAPSPPRQGVEREKIARAICCPTGCVHLGDGDDRPCYCDTSDFRGSGVERKTDAVLALLQPEGDGR